MNDRLIIAGGREYRLTGSDFAFLNSLHKPVAVLCGGCRGADADGRWWAKSCGIPVEEYPADWGKYGLAAGPIRNEMMASKATAVVLFRGGAGTASMHKYAVKAGLTTYDLRGSVMILDDHSATKGAKK